MVDLLGFGDEDVLSTNSAPAPSVPPAMNKALPAVASNPLDGAQFFSLIFLKLNLQQVMTTLLTSKRHLQLRVLFHHLQPQRLMYSTFLDLPKLQRRQHPPSCSPSKQRLEDSAEVLIRQCHPALIDNRSPLLCSHQRLSAAHRFSLLRQHQVHGQQ